MKGGGTRGSGEEGSGDAGRRDGGKRGGGKRGRGEEGRGDAETRRRNRRIVASVRLPVSPPRVSASVFHPSSLPPLALPVELREYPRRQQTG